MKLARIAAATALALTAGCYKTAPSPEMEARVKKLEDANAKYAEALDFLQKVYDQQKQQSAAQDEREPAPDAVFAVEIASNLKLGQTDGPASAPVTIVEVFDFACPYCARVSPILDELVKTNGGKVRVVYKNMIIHPEMAQPAHLAACAAAKQGKYVAFKAAFWDQGFGPYAASSGQDRASMGSDNIEKIASSLQLDLTRFKTDMAGSECAQLIKADMAELEKFNVSATPTFFINGTFIAGALPKEDFQKLIDEKAAAVASSGVPAADYYQRVVLGKGEKKFRSKTAPKP